MPGKLSAKRARARARLAGKSGREIIHLVFCPYVAPFFFFVLFLLPIEIVRPRLNANAPDTKVVLIVVWGERGLVKFVFMAICADNGYANVAGDDKSKARSKVGWRHTLRYAGVADSKYYVLRATGFLYRKFQSYRSSEKMK